MRTLNLNALDTASAQLELDGVTYPVREITVRIASMLEAAAEAKDGAKIIAYLDVVGALVPSLPREKLEDLTVKQLLGIVTLASDEVEAVEEAAGVSRVTDPNATSSAPAAAAPPSEPAPAAAT